jgi:hypothetical protein
MGKILYEPIGRGIAAAVLDESTLFWEGLPEGYRKDWGTNLWRTREGVWIVGRWKVGRGYWHPQRDRLPYWQVTPEQAVSWFHENSYEELPEILFEDLARGTEATQPTAPTPTGSSSTLTPAQSHPTPSLPLPLPFAPDPTPAPSAPAQPPTPPRPATEGEPGLEAPPSAEETQAEEDQPSALVLGGPEDEPIVLGQRKPRLTPGQYRVVKAMLDAAPTRLSKDQLARRSETEDPIGMIDRLRRDQDWAAVLDKPGQAHGGYGLRLNTPRKT